MKAMLLAAGRGERMGEMTRTCPKPLLSVAGKPLLQHQLDRLAAAGVQDVVINAAYLKERIIDFVENEMDTPAQVRLSLEAERLETGGGIAKALPLLGDEPFLLVNSDVWCDFPLRSLVQKSLQGLAHLVMVSNPEHHPEGDFVLEDDGRVTSDTTVRRDRLTFSGISLLSPRLFERAPNGRFPLAPLLKQAMSQQCVSGEWYDGCWMDVGTPERLEALEQVLKAGRQ